ncbi:hypothetical protein GS416_11785 [Rhodococcus hoagii]|nr:hypothetical protein [Prescottella equi]
MKGLVHTHARNETPPTNPLAVSKLSDEWAVDPQPPVQVSLFGKPYDIRCDFTGSEVLEFSRLLRKTRRSATTAKHRRSSQGTVGRTVPVHLADGDPSQLAADIGEQNTGVADKLINTIYKHAGLLDAEGNFRAL